jgi:2-polyprenyl-3-methyl-5-hydroxy-6-metoxy-1,4-benzoquinol methylase
MGKGMYKITDWAGLWRELVEVQLRRKHKGPDPGRDNPDVWRHKARDYDALVKSRWAEPDSSRTFILGQLDRCPGATVLDIGAGTGAWALLMAAHASRVTALEPSTAMIEVLQEKLEAEGIANMHVVQGSWPEANVERHDFTLCSHSMYSCPDLPAFIRHMEEVTRHTCFLLLRAPSADGLMAQAAQRIWGQPYDSPNFPIAYNALLQMGICANVLMEDTALWAGWSHASLDEALAETKRRFGLLESTEHDAFLQDLLARHLTYSEGRYVWPPAVRSALVYWDVDQAHIADSGLSG